MASDKFASLSQYTLPQHHQQYALMMESIIYLPHQRHKLFWNLSIGGGGEALGRDASKWGAPELHQEMAIINPERERWFFAGHSASTTPLQLDQFYWTIYNCLYSGGKWQKRSFWTSSFKSTLCWVDVNAAVVCLTCFSLASLPPWRMLFPGSTFRGSIAIEANCTVIAICSLVCSHQNQSLI